MCKEILCLSFLVLGLNGTAHAIDTGFDLLKNCEAVGLLDHSKADDVIASAEKHQNPDDTDKETINQLDELLSNTNTLRSASCLSFLSGFGGADALSPLSRKGRRMFCIPKDVSLRQAASLTVEWMRNNEDKLHFGAHEVLAMSNIVNFPCPRT